MRLRTFAMIMLAILLLSAIAPVAMASGLSHHPVVFAQDSGSDSDQSESGTHGGKGQKDPEAQTDPGKGDKAAEGEEEEGPPWTYQMARLTIGLILLLAVGIALMYRRMIGVRQKSNA